MSLDLNKLDKKVTDALNQMTDEDWKAYKNKMVVNSFNQAFVVKKSIISKYYKHNDFEWQLTDLYNTLEEISGDTIRVNDGKLQDYLLENKIIKKYMRHHEKDINFELFYNKVWSLMYPNETTLPYDINKK